MEKKVIKQKYYKPFEIDFREKDIFEIWQIDGSESSVILIERENATEVAKAIDPNYKKLEDERDRLLELILIAKNNAVANAQYEFAHELNKVLTKHK